MVMVRRSKTENEIMRGKNLMISWDKTKREWGVYRKNDMKSSLLRIGNDEDVVRFCRAFRNVEFPSELQPVAERMEAEKEAEEEARAEQEKVEDEARAERREKYLESLSEKERKDVLERERERERNREDVLEQKREDAQEQEKREYERKPKPGKKRKVAQKPKGRPQSLLDIINEEPEEVFPWEKG